MPQCPIADDANTGGAIEVLSGVQPRATALINEPEDTNRLKLEYSIHA